MQHTGRNAAERGNPDIKDAVVGAILGGAIGDALGVPVEFSDRHHLDRNPVTDMRAFGSHNQQAGTFSDDTSLTLCMVESLTHGIDIEDMGRMFLRWYKDYHWSAHGEIFDIGMTTCEALVRLLHGTSAWKSGLEGEYNNGNGSLMRILPLLFAIRHYPLEKRWEITKAVSSITHAHVRSIIACFFLLEFALELLLHNDKHLAYKRTQKRVSGFLRGQKFETDEMRMFSRILTSDILEIERNQIRSTTYVVDSLEASLWSLLTTNSFREAVTKSVNLGGDTDTIGAITGGLAGILYGRDSIPEKWLSVLAKSTEIEALIDEFYACIKQSDATLTWVDIPEGSQ